MPILDSNLRRSLERAIIAARGIAESAALEALALLAVDQEKPYLSMSQTQRGLRVALRVEQRRLGGGTEGLTRLAEEGGYVQWHRMLFARFLAENSLLIHPTLNVPVTLAECAELAAEEGEPDAWVLAARYAAAMLPGIFRADDPLSQLRLAPEGRRELEAILNGIERAVFIADDALGWVYQFWQSRRKDEVNKSERKIGGADLAPVTQLFTEHYMVRFLLENSLGAWWAARHPDSALLGEWRYLRRREDGTPAAGTFPGWPERAAEITVMDPCCGSGHFPVEAFLMLRAMRMEAEGLSGAAAADAVLRDNIYGLELDPRCTQIAAFALAFVAWKLDGYRAMPPLNIACSGLAVTGSLESWARLAGDDGRLRGALERLHALFSNAPDLGSLINPADLPPAERMFVADYAEVEPLLRRALRRERGDDPAAAVFGAAAEGVARAARLLAGKYTLVATNVPYLLRRKQSQVLQEFANSYYAASRNDLATIFLERCLDFATYNGSIVIVTPQNWLFLKSYDSLRRDFLKTSEWNFLALLGSGAFQVISGEVVNVICVVISRRLPQSNHVIAGVDITKVFSFDEKYLALITNNLQFIDQIRQQENPDARINLNNSYNLVLLQEYAQSFQGIVTGDYPHYRRNFWEVQEIEDEWIFLQSTVNKVTAFGGREHVLFWQNNGQNYATNPQARMQGKMAWGKHGVTVSQMSDLLPTLYTGDIFDINAATIIPYNQEYLSAIWAFCSSEEFNIEVRKIDRALKVTNATLVKVPFDLERWQQVAEEAGPLPEPHSDDPTQWLFKGLPADCTAPLQVAVARLLGYRWPAEDEAQAEQMRVRSTPAERQMLRALDRLADADGIVCLPALGGAQAADERLRALLAVAYGAQWSPQLLDQLLEQTGGTQRTLAGWLRDEFFAQHCRLFHNRPFIWQVWDGRKDGFAALVNYHRLDRATLEKLAYSTLGDWIAQQERAQKAGDPQAEGRREAARTLQRKLALILAGAPPHDIYVRWKPLAAQPLGWDPDLNDGVRLNIRPFITAGVLRSKFTLNWNKDRGKNPDGSERLNDLHHTIAEKEAARAAAKAAHVAAPQEEIPAMYLHKITISNIKNIAALELDFTHDGAARTWTTILGPNGVGKSTIMQAIGVALAGPRSGGGLVNLGGWVRHGADYGSIAIEVKRDAVRDRPVGSTPLRTLMSYPTLVARYAVTGDNITKIPAVFESYEINSLLAWPDERGERGQEYLLDALRTAERGWLVCGYGPYRRLRGDALSDETLDPRDERLMTLFREERALTGVANWILGLYNLSREKDARAERQYEQVRRVFEQHFLPEAADLITTATSVRLRITDDEGNVRLPVPFEDLSDGYRSMVALGGDLLRRLTEAYPDAEDITQCPGIVLIDELDAHAHPKWQRQIGHWLREKFPYIQFIVTTHSPFLAQVADEPGGNIVLENGADGVQQRTDVESVKWWRVDQILTNLFGLETTRSADVDAKQNRLEELYMQSHLTAKDREELASLHQWAASLPPAIEDPEEFRKARQLQETLERHRSQIGELE